MKQSVKRNMLIGFVTALLGVTPLASASAANHAVTITFYEAMPGKLGTELTTLTSAFERSHPNVHVQLIYTGSYKTQQQKLTAALAAHQPPTIAQVEETWTTEYQQNGLLQPLQGLLPSAVVRDLVPAFREDNSYNGKLVTVPFNKSAYVLFYNTDDFKRAGISAPPTTWKMLERDAIKLHRGGTYGFGMQADYYTFEMYLRQAGGQILSKDDTKAMFDSAAGRSALGWMVRLADQDKAATVIGGNAYLSDGFNTNQYAMDIDTTAAMSFLTNPKTHWAVAPLPSGVTRAVPTGGTNIALFKGASAAQQQAAGAYLSFLLSDASTLTWAENTGYLPVRQSAIMSAAWKAYGKAHPQSAVAPSEMKDFYFSPRLAAMSSGVTAVSTEIGNCLAGSQSIAETLANGVDDINQALASN